MRRKCFVGVGTLCFHSTRTAYTLYSFGGAVLVYLFVVQHNRHYQYMQLAYTALNFGRLRERQHTSSYHHRSQLVLEKAAAKSPWALGGFHRTIHWSKKTARSYAAGSQRRRNTISATILADAPIMQRLLREADRRLTPGNCEWVCVCVCASYLFIL